jgi:hypothetical protein
MLMSYSQKAGQKHSKNWANRSFEDVVKFKYLGTTLTDRIFLREEIKSRLNLGKILLSSHLLARNVKVKTHKTIILPVVLYECQTWSLTLSTGRRLRVFDNKVLRTLFGPNREEVTGEWRKLHNEWHHILYSSPNIITQIKSRRMRWAGHVARMGEERNVYKVFMGKAEGKKPLGRPGRRWNGIGMDIREIG